MNKKPDDLIMKVLKYNYKKYSTKTETGPNGHLPTGDLLSNCGIVYLEDREESAEDNFAAAKKEILRATLMGMGGSRTNPIILYINTAGGVANEALALYDMVNYLTKNGTHIIALTQGYAFSGGAIVLQAGNKRLATENSFIMIHEVAIESTGGSVKDMTIELQSMKKIQTGIIKIWAKNMKMPVGQLSKLLKKGDVYYTAIEAKKAGLIDEVI